MTRRSKIHDAARCLGAKIDTKLEANIMDAAIDQLDPSRAHDPNKSDALNIAIGAVEDAEQTLQSTQETYEEIKSAAADAPAEARPDDG